MNHYTYEIEFENGMKYIGVRSCKCPIEQDSYLGSSNVIPSELYATCTKSILNTFDTRIEALQNEIKLHKKLDIAVNPSYYNQVKQTTGKFDQQGTTKETHEHIARMAEKLKGRTKKDWEYLEAKGKKSSALRGDKRTPAQKEADKRISQKQKGVKNPAKGNPSTNHPKFKPWYFITPEGEYYEVNDSIRNFVKTDSNVHGFTAGQLGNALANKPNYPILRGNFKGYVFGYVHSKPNYLTQENILLAIQVLQHLPLKSPNKEICTKPRGGIENITGKK